MEHRSKIKRFTVFTPRDNKSGTVSQHQYPESARKSAKGWGWAYKAKKRHYFMNGYSLCGRWSITLVRGYLFDLFHWSSNNCKTCAQKRLKVVRHDS